MSSKKSKLDLLVRVRYQNPLPPPPYPPKLLNIPTDPARYATLDFTWDLANEMPFPMVVDAEMGMPLDLSRYESLWQDGGDPLELNPDPNNLPPVDPKDEFLLEGLNVQAGPSRPGSQTTSQPLQVSWLRRTEYVTAKDGGSRAHIIAREEEEVEVDISREAQIRDVEGTFPPSYEGIDISTLRHPSYPKRRAVETYELLPDPETFATPCDVFRFSERPGERPMDQEDPRLDCAILRPVITDDGDNFLAYYLPRDDEQALRLKEQRNLALELNLPSDDDPIPFDLIRDYESHALRSEQGNDLVLLLDDGVLSAHADAVGSTRQVEQRAKGAYYKTINRRLILKRKRLNPDENSEYRTKMDVIKLSYRPMDDSESAERFLELEELMNPFYEPPEEEEEEGAAMATESQPIANGHDDDF